MSQPQRPLELILARNLITNLATPAVLTDEDGGVLFYNQAAGELLACDFEPGGAADTGLWEHIGPFDLDGERLPAESLLLTAARRGSPAQVRARIRGFDGRGHDVEVSALPILTTQGARGALAFFWTQPEPSPRRGDHGGRDDSTAS